MTAFQVTDSQAAQFAADGYLFVPKLLDDEETQLLYRIAKADQAMLDRARNGYGRDTKGNVTSILIHNELDDDIRVSTLMKTVDIADAARVRLHAQISFR